MAKKLISIRITEELQGEVRDHPSYTNFTEFVENALEFVLETSDFEDFLEEKSKK